ncbi:hypothetical protein CRG98_018719 [Punica granatum]|uniref:Uncharacterized protein n=1 Tax=Punica granatum TaxID=22663 RepID=A0A2I0JX62_PUNGR|nr:hypothetical protein CRG98_018719 [Punica granatum]
MGPTPLTVYHGCNTSHRLSRVQRPFTPSARNPSAESGLALTYRFAPSSVYVEDDSDWGGLWSVSKRSKCFIEVTMSKRVRNV